MKRGDLVVPLGLAAILAGGLLLLGDRPPLPAEGHAAAAAAAVASPEPAAVSPALAERPAPVPLHLRHRPAYGVPTVEALIAAAAGDPAADGAGEPGAGEDIAAAAARGAAEADGYRDVRVIGRAADGSWRASALRGRTRVLLTVDPGGAVSAD